MMTEGVDLTIVIRKANGQMAVSTLPKSNGLKDEAQNHIVPLTVSGLPEELDAGFLQTVARPIQKVAGLITNMAQFEAQADKAAADSKAAKEEKAKETKEEKEKREKYEKHLKKAEELIAAGKHSEAVSALGQARLHAKPQDLKKIDSMVEEQKKAMNKGSLFELMDEPAPQPQPQPQQQPQPMAATAQQPQPRPMAVPVQQPPYPPQPQAPRPIAGQPQRPMTAQPLQQPSMWPRNNRRKDRFRHSRNMPDNSLRLRSLHTGHSLTRTGRNRHSLPKTTLRNIPRTEKSITIPRITRNIPIFPNPC